jgi:cysteine/glycine-rich protein
MEKGTYSHVLASAAHKRSNSTPPELAESNPEERAAVEEEKSEEQS